MPSSPAMRGSAGCCREVCLVLEGKGRLKGRGHEEARSSALDRIRTCDLGLRRSLLCPLSYEGVSLLSLTPPSQKQGRCRNCRRAKALFQQFRNCGISCLFAPLSDGFRRRASQRMGNHHIASIGRSGDSQGLTSKFLKCRGGENYGRNPRFFQLCEIVDTPRSARPSISRAGQDGLHLLGKLCDGLGLSGQSCILSLYANYLRSSAIGNLACRSLQQSISVRLVICKDAEPSPPKRSERRSQHPRRSSRVADRRIYFHLIRLVGNGRLV